MVKILPADSRTKTLTHTVLTTSASSQEALAANTARRYVLIQNDDASNTAYIKVGAAAAVNQGIKLAAGASYEISNAAGNLDTAAINAIAGAGTPKLLITEGVVA